MDKQIQLGDITVDVVLKKIKNVHLSVYPPTGRVRISAPSRMDMKTLRAFAIGKLDWIRKHQRKIGAQKREAPREYVERETHFLWGRQYLMEIAESNRSGVELAHDKMILRTRPGSTTRQRHVLVQEWYRQQLKDALPALLERWESVMGVSPSAVTVRRMKRLWGSCSPHRGTIRVNLDLAKKPLECLEYILVHEMVHLLERTHNSRFVSLLDGFLPNWRHCRDELNRLPVPHQDWGY